MSEIGVLFASRGVEKFAGLSEIVLLDGRIRVNNDTFFSRKNPIMENPCQAVGTAAGHTEHTDLVQEAKSQVNTILARTDWHQFWSDVSKQADGEIKAYEAACARSLASASRKFVC